MKHLHLFSLCCFLHLFANPLSAQEPGLFADFETSAGNFRARLDFEKAPMTVGNFVGLIEGSQPYVSLSSGQVKKGQFYDGIIFHRVLGDFVIQGGSPLGNGTDGPGYEFRDEFDPDLKHDGAYVLSMANSGIHTNGSQFFVTLAATPHLDEVHSVFGKVIEGMGTVDAIGKTETDSNDKPLTDVVMKSVRIVRVGPDAEAFDPSVQGLPQPGMTASNLLVEDGKFVVTFPPSKNTFYLIFHSPDLNEWTGASIGLVTDALTTTSFNVDNLAGKDRQHFFRVVDIGYPNVFTPGSIQSRTLTLNINKLAGEDSTVIAVFSFDDQNTGVSKLNDEEDGVISLYVYQQRPYAGALTINSSSIVPLDISLDFIAEGEGKFSGTTIPTLSNPQQFALSGTFILTE